MTQQDVFRRIDRYLRSEDNRPRLVNINRVEDMIAFRSHYDVSGNKIVDVSGFVSDDAKLDLAALANTLGELRGNIFLIGFTTYLLFEGADVVESFLRSFPVRSCVGSKIVVLCYQCAEWLDAFNERDASIVYNVDGSYSLKPEITLVTSFSALQNDACKATSLVDAAKLIETKESSVIFIRSSRRMQDLSASRFVIKDERGVFSSLKKLDHSTSSLEESWGNEELWGTAYAAILDCGSWNAYLTQKLALPQNLDFVIDRYAQFSDYEKWLFFIALKLYGCANNLCLKYAAGCSDNWNSIPRNCVRSLLEEPLHSQKFAQHYADRKRVLKGIKPSQLEISDYYALLEQKGTDAIWYMTNSSRFEQERIISFLDHYGAELDRNDLMLALATIWPQLHAYLVPYTHGDGLDLLDSYFADYKYQKVINKLLPAFEEVVNAQAVSRDYNLILQPRATVLSGIPKNGTQVYFMDAMGVEYMSYIQWKCENLGLLANMSVARANLPTLTGCNRDEIYSVFNNPEPKKVEPSLDDIKHHGEDDCDYTRTKLPVYIIKELEIIDGVLDSVRDKLSGDENYERALLVADHGASRLVILKDKVLDLDVDVRGTHGGRICTYDDTVASLPNATIEDDCLILADYQRFDHARKASVETHGGATLEEVAVPIVELMLKPTDIEIKVEDDSKVITIRRKEIPVLKLFSKTKVPLIRVRINDKYYPATMVDERHFSIALPDIGKGNFIADVYIGNNLIQTGLSFTVKSRLGGDNDRMGL